jgi:hypothetical protein
MASYGIACRMILSPSSGPRREVLPGKGAGAQQPAAHAAAFPVPNLLPRWLCVAILLVATGAMPVALAASPLKAGYDLLQTESGASIDLSKVAGPGLSISPSTVPLRGVPICTCTGGTDTIMYRIQDVPPVGGKCGRKMAAQGSDRCVSLSVVALFLKNSEAVTINGRPVDVYVTVNHSNGVIGQGALPQPDSRLPESTGWLTVHTNGTFDSEIHVVADVIVVPVGADVKTLANQLSHMQGPTVDLTSSGSAWSPTPPAGYPAECFFPANGFYPGGSVPETAPLHAHPVAPGTNTVFTAKLNADPAKYQGRCPGGAPPHIKFAGTITASGPGTVKYLFIHHDGSKGPGGTLVFNGPGSQSVVEDLAPFAKPVGEGWHAIEILSPTSLVSNRAYFSWNCTR